MTAHHKGMPVRDNSLFLVEELDDAGFGSMQWHEGYLYGHTKDKDKAQAMVATGWEVVQIHPDPEVWSVKMLLIPLAPVGEA